MTKDSRVWEKKDDSRVLRNTILFFGVIIVLAIIIMLIAPTVDETVFKVDSTTQKQAVAPKTRICSDFNDLYFDFHGGTDLQIKEMEKQYVGKCIKFSFQVSNVKDAFLSDLTIHGNHVLTSKEFIPYIHVILRDDQESKAMRLGKGNPVTVEAEFRDYSGFNGFWFKNGKIV